jgi:ADP-ribose pyrophosphatase YjhB (NUDIX family)
MPSAEAIGIIFTRMNYTFCPKCGGKLSLTRIKAIEPERLVCEECSFIFYLNPKVAACTICTIDQEIPLLKRGIEPSYGKWVFPGGFVDLGERVEDAAIRETKEEVNLDVELRELVGVYSYSNSPVVIIVYAADIIGGEFSACDECLEVRTFAPNEIPWNELAFPSTYEALRDYVRKYFK